jgi:hypothetical protein
VQQRAHRHGRQQRLSKDCQIVNFHIKTPDLEVFLSGKIWYILKTNLATLSKGDVERQNPNT